MVRQTRTMFAAAVALWLGGCAGPHGEKPALDNAVARPGATPYGFSGGYLGTTGGGFRQ